jgi:uncharacterized protein (DUF2062 family)
VFCDRTIELILKRAKTESFLTRLRLVVWPRRSFSRSFAYFGKRIARLRASPQSIALGLAAGVFAACTPLLGFHIMIALVIAWFLSGNYVAAALGTAFCNPLTFPFIIAGDIKLGALILHKPPIKALASEAAPETIGNLWSLEHISRLWHPVLKPMLVGSVPIGLVCAIVSYFIGAYAVRVFKERRAVKMASAR